jgi:hypothetical protein
MLTGDADVVLRIRGTFIDFVQHAPCMNRSHGAPPGRLGNTSDASRQVDEWIERASHLFFSQTKSKSPSTLHPQEHDGGVTSCDPNLPEQDTMCMNLRDTKINQFEDQRQGRPTKKCNLPQAEARSLQCPGGKSPVATNLASADPRLQTQFPRDESSLSTKVTRAETATEVTTLMISNIACNMKAAHILDKVNEHGFSNAYNLLFMPMSISTPSKSTNLGYAFMNFKTQEYAEAFANAFQNVHFSNRSKKLCHTRPARYQGFEASMKMHLSNNGPGWLGIAGDDGLFRRISK